KPCLIRQIRRRDRPQLPEAIDEISNAAPPTGDEGFAFQEHLCHPAPIPQPTSCAASARPLPNNNPAPSFRHPPRTSACSSVRGRNLHDNAFRARTRESTST